MKWILFVYLSTFSAQGGIAVTSAEFDDRESCSAAAEAVKKEFKTFFVQPAKAICVEKGRP